MWATAMQVISYSWPSSVAMQAVDARHHTRAVESFETEMRSGPQRVRATTWSSCPLYTSSPQSRHACRLLQEVTRKCVCECCVS